MPDSSLRAPAVAGALSAVLSRSLRSFLSGRGVLAVLGVLAGLTASPRAQDPATKPAPAAASAAEAAASAAKLGEAIDALCKPLLEADVAVGFVVGVVHGDTTFVRGYGAVERGTDRAPDGDTLYEIGSISKVFTGVLLADAVERGLCKLEDPVQRLLPAETKLRAWKEQPVLLWHLSTHTSGLPRLPSMADGDDRDPYAHFDDAQLLAAIPEAAVRWEPGSKYEYSNLGAGLLGFVLVRANGCATYDELLSKRITGPLGMRDTAVVLPPALRERLAPPYDAEGEPNHTWALASLAGAGGIRSSMNDMLKFARAQFPPAAGAAASGAGGNGAGGAGGADGAGGSGGELAKATALALEKRHDGANGHAMGLGWHFALDGSTRWHNGQTGGYHGWLGVIPAERLGVCVLTNTAAGHVDQLGERILQRAWGTDVAPQQIAKAIALPRAALERYVGKYRMGPGREFAVTLGERGLSAQLTGQPALRIHARSETEFFYRAVPASIVFQLDGTKVTGLVLHQNGREIPCARVEPPAK